MRRRHAQRAVGSRGLLVHRNLHTHSVHRVHTIQRKRFPDRLVYPPGNDHIRRLHSDLTAHLWTVHSVQHRLQPVHDILGLLDDANPRSLLHRRPLRRRLQKHQPNNRQRHQHPQPGHRTAPRRDHPPQRRRHLHRRHPLRLLQPVRNRIRPPHNPPRRLGRMRHRNPSLPPQPPLQLRIPRRRSRALAAAPRQHRRHHRRNRPRLPPPPQQPGVHHARLLDRRADGNRRRRAQRRRASRPRRRRRRPPGAPHHAHAHSAQLPDARQAHRSAVGGRDHLLAVHREARGLARRAVDVREAGHVFPRQDVHRAHGAERYDARAARRDGYGCHHDECRRQDAGRHGAEERGGRQRRRRWDECSAGRWQRRQRAERQQ